MINSFLVFNGAYDSDRWTTCAYDMRGHGVRGFSVHGYYMHGQASSCVVMVRAVMACAVMT